MTPEGRVKTLINDYLHGELTSLLTSRGFELYNVRHVPGGYGRSNQLDYALCIAGHLVLIEAKAPGKWLRPLQYATCQNAYRSGATIFFISGSEGLDAFKRWVEKHERHWHA